MIAVGATAKSDGGIGVGDDRSGRVGRSMGSIGESNTVAGSGELNVTSFKIDDLIDLLCQIWQSNHQDLLEHGHNVLSGQWNFVVKLVIE